MNQPVGDILAVEAHAFQGGFSQVETLVTVRGRFVRKCADAAELDRECAVLAALDGGDATVKTARVAGREDGAALYEELPGANLAVLFAEAPERRLPLAAAFGAALREIHRWTPSLRRPAADWLDRAVARCHASAARYEGAAIENPASPFHGIAADQVAEQIARERGALITDLVFCHGDWCLPNALAEGETVTGAVDWSCGGWAERRYDLATALWSLRYNSIDDPRTPRYLDAFLEGYGWRGGAESLTYFEAIYALL